LHRVSKVIGAFRTPKRKAEAVFSNFVAEYQEYEDGDLIQLSVFLLSKARKVMRKTYTDILSNKLSRSERLF